MTVYNTSRGLVGLIRYQLEYDQSEFNCVFLGKIQSGCIESHFGHLRKLAGVNYGRVSDKKTVIGTWSSIKWFRYSVIELSTRVAICDRLREAEIFVVKESLVNAASEAEFEDLEVSTRAAALGHIARYFTVQIYSLKRTLHLFRLFLKKARVDKFKVFTVFFSERLDRGKMLVPSFTAINETVKICHTW